jgi:hypothetical protein
MNTTTNFHRSLATALLCSAFAAGISCGESESPKRLRQAIASGDVGREWRHDPAMSRFLLGASSEVRTEGSLRRIIGRHGVIAIEANGSILTVPNATSPVHDAGPFSQNPSEHHALVQEYFRASGLPSEELGGLSVTTQMRGSGRRDLPKGKDELVGYTTHIERRVGGIPVPASQAWAMFNARREVVSEGVYWPAISADVVSAAQQLLARTQQPAELQKLRESIRQTFPELGNLDGTVVILHAPSSHQGGFYAMAAYQVIAPSKGGKASLLRFDADGKRIVTPEEKPAPIPGGVRAATP